MKMVAFDQIKQNESSNVMLSIEGQGNLKNNEKSSQREEELSHKVLLKCLCLPQYYPHILDMDVSYIQYYSQNIYHLSIHFHVTNSYNN